MEIFKKTVLKRHKQDENLLKGRWENLQKYKSKIDFIRNIKEEKYQDGFLRDVFENCLGYVLDTTNPEHFNIRREEKNETDNKKADAVILVDDKVIGIIELKDQKTKNLDSVEIQAFNYHNSHSNSKYIIISNFDEVRFYIDKKTKFESFSLFNLDFESFKLLHLVLSFESISINLPIKLLDETNEFEKEISNLFYKDFAELRLQLFSDISNLNQIEKLEALAISQKILDRFIFIFFAEDRYLLNPKISDEILKKWKNDIEFRSLFYFIKVLFNAVNSGNVRMDIPAYNGGLFANDHKIDNLEISDSVLEKIIQLSKYDFSSDIDVNILGHIFENSLDDLGKIRENIFGGEFDISRAKRKKDGIFYTPNYITEYIVRETVGKFCDEKKVELGFMNFDEIKSLETAKSYLQFLENLKIIDPAVGSGAFLNQAFNYLFDEYKSVYETIHKFAISGQNLFLTQDFDITIIENNLFGVDINQEAVEIAKLSLWLKTAKRGRKLTNLNRNIICADSLLNMPFEFGSFDIVIGNPPYVRQEMIKQIKPHLEEKFKIYSGTADLYVYFYELAYRLLKNSGRNGFICSNKFFRAKYGENLRTFILDKMQIEIVVDFNGIKVFEDATVDSTITILHKNSPKLDNKFKFVNSDLINFLLLNQADLTSSSFSFANSQELEIKKKIEAIGTPLKEWDIKIYRGILTGFNEAFIIDTAKKEELVTKDPKSAEIIKPMLRGRDIKRYGYEWAGLYVIYVPWDFNTSQYPVIVQHLEKYKLELSSRPEVKQNRFPWYALSRYASDYWQDFEKEKIVYPCIMTQGSTFAYNKMNMCKLSLLLIIMDMVNLSLNLNIYYAIIKFIKFSIYLYENNIYQDLGY